MALTKTPKFLNSGEVVMAKILLVEYSATVAQDALLLLRAQGYDVLLAHDGQMAVDLLRGGQDVDLVLVDYHIPKMNGLDLVRHIQDVLKKCDLPCVLWCEGDDDGLQSAANRRRAGFVNRGVRGWQKRLLHEIVSRLSVAA